MKPTELDITQAGKLKELGLFEDCEKHIISYKEKHCSSENPCGGFSYCENCSLKDMYLIDKTKGERSEEWIGPLPNSDECWPVILDITLKLSMSEMFKLINEGLKATGEENLAQAMRQTIINLKGGE